MRESTHTGENRDRKQFEFRNLIMGCLREDIAISQTAIDHMTKAEEDNS
tara:strand:+ start:1116 stop:1262 length:147 start_codon:yes stop_codon:yes gene_type:complete